METPAKARRTGKPSPSKPDGRVGHAAHRPQVGVGRVAAISCGRVNVSDNGHSWHCELSSLVVQQTVQHQ